MVALCAGALAVGVLASFVLPFLLFAGCLAASILIGAVVALTRSYGIEDIVLSSFGLLVACQLGYGLGLGLTALADAVIRSRWRPRQRPDPTLQDPRLRPKKEAPR